MNITGEQVRAAYAAAPAPIRETFSSDETTRIILDLQTRHKLHVDSTGVLGKQVGYLLLGLISPMEFLGGLVEAGVSAEAAKDIVGEVNERIFIPLRQKMQGVAPVSRPAPAAPVSFAAPVPERAPAAPLVAPPSVVSSSQAQVFTSTGGWPGAPAGNWQPAAAVHVYVPGPAPVHTPATPAPVVTQPVSVTTLQQSIQPEPQTPKATTSVATQPPALRPTPPPPANLLGVPASESAQPLEKGYVADPYREPPL